jgi:hypothetical protein
MSDLAALIEWLEAANKGNRDFDLAIAKQALGLRPIATFRGTQVCNPAQPGGASWDLKPYTTSVDAALTLVPEGWSIKLEIGHRYDGEHRYCHCTLDHDADTVDRDLRPDEPFEVEADNLPTPALALCVATLKARAIG